MKTVNGQSAKSVPDLSQRSAGVLMHITSLPGKYGIGDLGPAAHRWITLLADAGQRWWQMLPLGPAGEGNSPYRCYSAFAGNPLLISPDSLVEEGLLSKRNMVGSLLPPGKVNYKKVSLSKMRLLHIAHRQFRDQANHRIQSQFDSFVTGEQKWLDDFSLFLAIKDAHPKISWTQWPVPLRHRDLSALKNFRTEHADAIDFHRFTQFIFFRQLQSLRDRAREAGIGLIGDMPIFVSPESVDVWTHPRLFQLNRHLLPTCVAGVPPDLFSSSGQRWGNPLYNWKEMAKNDFAWWHDRLASATQQADLIRLDHFRGFESYWRIPADSPTAKTGEWIKAPGDKLFESLLAKTDPLPFVAEDLGVITPAVEQLRDRFSLPGMRILQFGFTGTPGNPHTPHNFIPHCFAYTATHDNDTTAAWYRSLPSDAKTRLRDYAPQMDWQRSASHALIQILYASTAMHAIVPLQDVLSLGSSARMNTPGQSTGNWTWRLNSFAECGEGFAFLKKIARTYDRTAAI